MYFDSETFDDCWCVAMTCHFLASVKVDTDLMSKRKNRRNSIPSFCIAPAPTTMATGATQTETHLLVLPYPAHGHMLALLDLTSQFAQRGLQITILVTPKNLPILEPILTAHPSIQTLVLPIPFHPQLPQGVENVKDLGNKGNPVMISALSRLQKPIADWFRDLPSPPSVIISDFFLGWTHNLSLQLGGVPWFSFFGVSSFLACVLFKLFSTDKNNMDYSYEFIEEELVVQFTDLPHSPSFKKDHLPSISRLYRESSADDPNAVVVKESLVSNFSSSWGCVFNSFRYLEGEYFDHVANTIISTKQGMGRKVFGVGPVNLLGSSSSSSGGGSGSGSGSGRSLKRVINDEAGKEVLDWLDTCRDSSVLYVSFGSQKWLSEPQSQALALALEQSGLRFIWVARARPGSKVVPDGFEQRVAGRGLVVKGYVPQVEVLNHRAVSGFLSHCGWNSFLEAVAAGVMILAWPMEADQFVNAKLLIQNMGVAVLACEGPDTVPDSNKLAQIIRESMHMGADVHMPKQRQRAWELKAKAAEAVREGGSSVKDLDDLVEVLNRIGGIGAGKK